VLLHFGRHFTVLDVISKLALYIRYHRNGKSCQREFDFLTLAVFADDMSPGAVLLVVKAGDGPIKSVNDCLADSRVKIRCGDQYIIIAADVTDKIMLVAVFGNRFTDNSGGGLNHIVAFGIAVVIVVGFKIIDIHQAKGNGCPGGNALFHYIFYGNPSGQARQGTGVQIHFLELL